MVGVLEKKEAIDFWFELEVDFFKVAGVTAVGVEDFFAMLCLVKSIHVSQTEHQNIHVDVTRIRWSWYFPPAWIIK